MNGNPFAVTPAGDMREGLSGIGDVLQDIGDQKKEREKVQAEENRKIQAQEAVMKSLEPGPDGNIDLDLVNKTAVLHPEYADITFAAMGAKDKQSQKRTLDRVRNLVTAPEEKYLETMEQNIAEGETAGLNMTESRRERDAYSQADEEGRKTLRTGAKIAYASMEDPQAFKVWNEANQAAEPLTGIAKARRDLDNKLITQEEFNKEVSKENPAHASAGTKILTNGTIIQSLSDGKTNVLGPDGTSLTGTARTEALKQAAAEELEFVRMKAGERAAGTQAITQSTKFFEQILPIRKSIENIDLATKALDDGAQTGVVMSKLPSIKAASIELDNIQKAMGLDVVGATTFGALSKGELDLALSRALPTNLQPAELRKWLVDKKAAQEKLATYIEDAAVYLGIPGNTIPGFINEQREMEKLRQDDKGTPFVEMSDDDLLSSIDKPQ